VLSEVPYKEYSNDAAPYLEDRKTIYYTLVSKIHSLIEFLGPLEKKSIRREFPVPLRIFEPRLLLTATTCLLVFFLHWTEKVSLIWGGAFCYILPHTVVIPLPIFLIWRWNLRNSVQLSL